MSFTVRAVLRTDKKNSKGLCPVSVVVTVLRKRTYHATGISTTVEMWDNGNSCIRKGFENATAYNTRISNKVAEIQRELLKAEDAGHTLTIRSARAMSGPTEADDFYKYAQKVISTHSNPGTKRRREYNLKSLKGFAPGKISFAEITPVFLTKFTDHLRHVDKMENNTSINTLSMIRAVFNHAIARGVTACYPFNDFKMPGYEQPQKTYLTLVEIDRIEALLQSEEYDDSLKNVAAHFLLECYSGIRFSDWHKFQTERILDDEHFYLSTTKTGEPIYLPLKDSPRLKGIVDYIRANGYVWKESNEHANRILKLIGPAAKIKKTLTTHVGRHTAATMFLEKGFSREAVAQILGVSMKIIDIYAKMTRQKIRSEFEKYGGL